jgi:N utilization substance protein B
MPLRSLERVRRASRKAALAALYAADLRSDVGALDCLADVVALGQPADAYSRDLVAGVSARQEELDAAIGAAAEHWSIERMPPVDRAVLRMSLYELRYLPEVPEGASINEAVELAKCFSTTDSGRFVNGVLGRLVTEVAPKAAHTGGRANYA